MHRPNRVMRQFKMRQSIPVPALDNDSLHNVTRIGHRNTDWKLYHVDAIRLWNRKFRLVVDGEEHGRSRQIDDEYMPWFERVTVRVRSPTVHGAGYRPLPYDPFVAGQHSMPQNLNFSTPSLDSHQSFPEPFGNVDLYDVFVSQQSSAGTSVPSYVYDTRMTSVHSSVVNTVQHLRPEHDTLHSFVDQDYHTNLGDEDVDLGRGRRKRRPTKCGTGHHLYY
ncbi:hypothetical protein F511_44824 [Dorcoceras hygrometricum]|uniref:Aminotransferase-like plant mobile domain-containing protein n=1 Tax=Dorcoceras hygrometricum TaxID=472368 RepID=A0A2Z6ZXX3_9LAMI|nr:hypothetical protein F511_44824 [Dorcoceras hygrometricum]